MERFAESIVPKHPKTKPSTIAIKSEPQNAAQNPFRLFMIVAQTKPIGPVRNPIKKSFPQLTGCSDVDCGGVLLVGELCAML